MEKPAAYWSDIEQYVRAQEPAAEHYRPLCGAPVSVSPGKPGVGRRDFLKLGGLAAVFSLAGCMQRPAEKIIPYLNRPEESVPGVANYYASSCSGCAMTCGLVVKVREGRPIKVEGNPDNPFNRGVLCARGQAAVFDLYDPDRARKPLRRSEQGAWEESSFADLDQEIAAKLKERKGEVVLLSGPWHGPARNSLAGKFISGLGQASHVRFAPLRDHAYAASRKVCLGRAEQSRYRLDRSHLTLSLGADIFASGRLYLENLRQFTAGRNPEAGEMPRLVAFEPSMSETGVLADERYPVATLDLVQVAGALVNQLLVVEKVSEYSQDDSLCQAFSRFEPEAVEKRLGLPAGVIARLADELWAGRGASLVLTENFSNQFDGDSALHAAGHLLNSILGNEGVTVESGTVGDQQDTDSSEALDSLVQRMDRGEVAAVIITGTNPVFYLPETSGFSRALLNVPLRISLSEHLDETSRLCHYVLPGLHALESWGDSEPLRGLFVFQQPTISPLWENRQAEDSLLALGAALGIAGFVNNEKTVVWRDYLKNHWKETIYPGLGLAADFEAFWLDSLKKGQAEVNLGTTPAAPPKLDTVAVAAALSETDETALSAGEYQLTLTAGSVHLDGRSVDNPWLLELPHPVTRITWDNYVCVSPADALEQGLADGDQVRLSVEGAETVLPVHVKPGQARGALTVDVGWGHVPAGAEEQTHGVNAFALAAAKGGRLTFTRRKARLIPTGKRVRLASVQGSADTHGRPIVFETTLEEFRLDPRAGQFEHAGGGHAGEPAALGHYPRATLWKEDEHQYPGHRWGMLIDLNRCNGCGACTLACQVENNIPYVGRREVLMGREMHWIRIDRYFSGDPSNPDSLYQPMLCHHCGHAPCETVCPVLATVHNDEGLNLQVYNRCVGTRYCSNNCPYKVRRFNYFEFSKEAYGERPLNFTLNPEVTVREKGVMEKCTFCVQRIREARYRAKERGTQVRDGEVVPACVQTCPTGALVFGDVNDPESRISKLLAEPRAFRALEELNTRPQVSYMTLVRNRAPRNNHGESAHHG